MEIGVNHNAYGGLDIRREAQILKDNGFTHFFADSFDKRLDEVMSVFVGEFGLICDTFHAPFKNINSIWSENDSGDEMLGVLKQAVDNAQKFSVPTIVVHLSSGDDAPQITVRGNERFKALVSYAATKNVKIAFENQRKLGNIAYEFEQCPEAVFCWDVGHEACFAYGREYMPIFSSRLAALHIHDNFGVHNEDLHMIPFDAAIDYEKAASHIAKANYDGTVMLEIFRWVSGRYDDISPEMYYERAANASKKLAKMIENRK